MNISFLKLFLCFSLISLFSWGCQRANSPPVAVNQNCRQVNHSQGVTCIPDDWQTLIALDSVTAEGAIALDIKPLGTTFSGISKHLEDRLTDVKNIGTTGEPNLEKILALKPDLIVGIDSQENIYPQLSKIAPTTLIKFTHSGNWKAVFQEFSTFIGKKEVAEEVMAKYDQRIAKFKEKMGDRPPVVSVVRIYPDSINLYLRDSFVGTILADAGLPRPESQNLSAEEAKKIAGNEIQMSISKELLSKADGDVIFIWTGENDPKINEELQTKIIALQKEPLWQNLKAVKNGRVYQVPSYWIGSGAIAANLVLDDLFKYLINEKKENQN
jgi:iron complex transport system substrate-binding protein